MKVILLKSVSSLGHIGEVKEVKNGYAQNYLLPNNLAVIATQTNIRAHKQKIEQGKKRKDREIKAEKKVAHSVDGASITIKAKADESGTLYGSVSPKVIIKVLKEQGYNLKESHLEMDEHIKKIGTTHVFVTVDDKRAKIQVNVSNE